VPATKAYSAITAGNNGIGFGIAEAFKNEGAIGAITGRNQATLYSVVKELGEGFIGVKGDVTNMDEFGKVYPLYMSASFGNDARNLSRVRYVPHQRTNEPSASVTMA
jgi:short-subunit dehydrogenase involved in D-alanine esterification of teichoic acids